MIDNITERLPGVSVIYQVPKTDLEQWARNLVHNAIATYKAELEAKESAEREDKLLTGRQVATKFSVSTKTITRWRKAGYLTPIPVGGVYKYRLSDIKKILEEGN